MSCPHSKPSSQAHQADIDEWNQLFFCPVDDLVFQQFNSGAQCAVDCDNLHAAFQQLDHSLPVAMNTDATIEAIKHKLYPDPISTTDLTKELQCHCAKLTHQCLLPSDSDLIAALKCVNTGTPPGPFADLTDLLWFYALTTQHTNDPDKEAIYPHLATFQQFLDIVDSADKDIIPSFSCQYFLALHKDVSDDTKLHLSVLGLMSIISLVPWKPLHMRQSLQNFYHPFNLVLLFRVACNSLPIASNPLYTSTCLALPFIPLLPKPLFSLILSTCSMWLHICNVNTFLIMMIYLGIWKQT